MAMQALPAATTSTTTSMAGFELISVDDPDRAAVARILARHSQTTPPTRALDNSDGHGLQLVATSDNLHHSMHAAAASTTNAPATLMDNLPALYRTLDLELFIRTHRTNPPKTSSPKNVYNLLDDDLVLVVPYICTLRDRALM
jgi:hypothetical protein